VYPTLTDCALGTLSVTVKFAFTVPELPLLRQ
jgi:hypothetical protein